MQAMRSHELMEFQEVQQTVLAFLREHAKD
jgi:hypothetical protein